MDSDDLTNFSHLTSRQIHRQPMAPSRSWKPTRRLHTSGGHLRNLRTIHMHLEGPGPIPVDDPEAAECHWGATERADGWCELVSGELVMFHKAKSLGENLPKNIIWRPL